MDINGGDKNRVFLHDLIKITEGTVSEGTIFMHIVTVHVGIVNLLIYNYDHVLYDFFHAWHVYLY